MNLPLDLMKFLQPDRLFNFQSSIHTSTIYFLLIVFGIFIVTAFIIKLVGKKHNTNQSVARLYQLYFNTFLTFGLIGMTYVWFRYERVYFLSARFWLIIWLVALILSLLYVLRYQFKHLPMAMEQSQTRKQFAKYLPKSKSN